MLRSLSCTGLLALVAATGTAFGQSTLQSQIGQIVPYIADTGWLDNPTNQPAVVAAFPIVVENSNWLRAYLEDANLPEGSSVRFTSMTDGETQILDRKGLTIWSLSSAYFNGDTMLVELIAGPNTVGNRILVKRLGIDTGIRPAGDPGQCGITGGADNRVPSGETWSGRIMPVGCSATVYCNTGGGMITAGHCVDGQTNLVMHFNVPASGGNCATNAPPVADQFPVTNFLFSNVGVGNDWGVMRVGTNSVGQTPFVRYGTFRPLAGAPAGNGTLGGMWGYGLDTNCVLSQTQQFSPGNIASVQGAYYDIFNDVRGGNSGSGYLNAANQVIGVVTHCRFDGSSNIAQRIDLPAFVSARATLDPCSAGGGSPPANNDCANAITVNLGTIAGTTLLATNDAVGTCGSSGASPDVWYSFTSACGGTYRFDTCGSSYDTVLGVYSACGGDVLACNDDHNGSCPNSLDSAIDISLAAGTYRIRVSGFNNQSGNFNLTVSGTSNAPANDACSSAQTALANIPYTGTTTCATNDGTANCASSATSPDVWYAYTATCSGTAVIDTVGSAYDTALSVHSGCPGNLTNLIACDDDGGGFPISRINLATTAGTTYYIRVNGFNNNSGAYQLNINDCTPDNNNCLAAAAIGNGATAFSNVDATTDGPSEPTRCTFFGNPQIAADIWYVYTASCTGTANVNTCAGASYDTELAVYAGTSCPIVESSIACNDDACGLLSSVDFPVVAGSSYLIRLGGYNGLTGTGTLTVGCTGAGGCPWEVPGGCASDQDADGDVDSDDINLFFVEFENGGSCGDHDGDDDTDSDDITLFFAAFENGAC